MTWRPLGAVLPTQLADARLQLAALERYEGADESTPEGRDALEQTEPSMRYASFIKLVVDREGGQVHRERVAVLGVRGDLAAEATVLGDLARDGGSGGGGGAAGLSASVPDSLDADAIARVLALEA